MDHNVFIHIGYPRTGTTFLQKDIFPDLADRFNVTVPQDALLRQYNEEIYQGSLNSEHLHQLYHECSTDKPLLLSHESLTGNSDRDFLHTAFEIHAFCPRATILICIRSQYAILPSMYTYTYLKNGGTEPYENFLTRLLSGDRFNYYQMIQTYRNLFGRDNVHILFFEKLQSDPDGFIQEVLDIIGASPKSIHRDGRRTYNRRYTMLYAGVLRFMNKVFATDCGGVRKNVRSSLLYMLGMLSYCMEQCHLMPGNTYEKNDTYRKMIADHYRTSNNDLFALLDRTPYMTEYPGIEMSGH